MISVLIESDLLLASVKREDRLKQVAQRILREADSGKLRGIYASVAALQEIVFWFYNRDLLDELVGVVNPLLHLKNVEWVELTPRICLTASVLMREYAISPFDAYHTATALSRDKVILSTEHVYDRIKGMTRVDPVEFATKI